MLLPGNLHLNISLVSLRARVQMPHLTRQWPKTNKWKWSPVIIWFSDSRSMTIAVPAVKSYTFWHTQPKRPNNHCFALFRTKASCNFGRSQTASGRLRRKLPFLQSNDVECNKCGPHLESEIDRNSTANSRGKSDYYNYIITTFKPPFSRLKAVEYVYVNKVHWKFNGWGAGRDSEVLWACPILQG